MIKKAERKNAKVHILSSAGTKSSLGLTSKPRFKDNVSHLLREFKFLGSKEASDVVQQVHGYERLEINCMNKLLAEKERLNTEDEVSKSFGDLSPHIRSREKIKPIGSYFVESPSRSQDGAPIKEED